MSGIINMLIGFLMTGVVVLAVIYVFNRFTTGGVNALGKSPIRQVIAGAKAG